nr:LacI family DNA-binding transcriptional regulator [uncultured Bacteroides sp.]
MSSTNKKKHVSLKQLAEELGVSISTVSRALKGSSEISQEMIDRVKALAKEMNYRPNPFAISLLKDTPRIIGIIVPDIVTHFYSSIISGIEDVATQNGYFAIITSSYEQYEREKQCVDHLINIRVEGIIACLSQETKNFSHFEDLANANIPIILFDRVCLTDMFSSVVADNSESARQVTLHLLNNGSRRIGFIGGSNHLDIVKQRKHGYLEALREKGISIERELVVCEKMTYDEGREATKKLLSLPNPPDAIVAMNDTLAFAAMKEIKQRGLRIPEDVALVGYTDEMHACYVEPNLTAVTHQTYKMGEAACNLLLNKLKNGEEIKQVVIPTQLQIRDSSIKRI